VTALLENFNSTLIACSWFSQYNLVVFYPISSHSLKVILLWLVHIHSKFQLIPLSGLPGREVKANFLKSRISVMLVLAKVTNYWPPPIIDHYTNYRPVVTKLLCDYTNAQGRDCLTCYLFGTLTMYWRWEIKHGTTHNVVTTIWHKKNWWITWCMVRKGDWRSLQCQRGFWWKRPGEWCRPVFYLLDCTIYSTKYIIWDGWNTWVALIHEKACKWIQIQVVTDKKGSLTS